MGSSLKIKGLPKLISMVKKIPTDIETGATNGIEEALMTWSKMASKIAMHETGALQANTTYDPNIAAFGDFIQGTVETKVYNGIHRGTGEPFNYALYWHDRFEAGALPKKRSGVGNHFTVIGDRNEAMLARKIGKGIRAEWTSTGWFQGYSKV